MKINREGFLRVLEMVQGGVAKRETVEQSKCLCFLDGQVMTYNDEILCQSPSGLPASIRGAVVAERLVGMLRKVPDEELDLKQKGGELLLSGQQKKGAFALEEQIVLPIDQVEKPGEWKKLRGDFCEAVKLVQECASERNATFARTCVHITPKWVEAYDNTQMCRRDFKTRFKSKSTMVRKESIKHVVGIAATEFSETDNWIHFRNADGLTFSIRKFLEEYPELDEHVVGVKGEPVTLPNGLDEILERVREFSQEYADADRVLMHVKPGRVTVTGKGVTGRWQEWRRTEDYDGGEYSFFVSPALMSDIVKRKLTQGELTADRFIVRGEDWTYLACLTPPEEAESDQGTEMGQEGEPVAVGAEAEE